MFLDEIGEVAPTVQAKLLRALQEREIRRVGGERTIKVQRPRRRGDQPRSARGGRRRARSARTSYFRLGAFVITVPPLRDRREDIPPLVHEFCPRAAARMKKDVRDGVGRRDDGADELPLAGQRPRARARDRARRDPRPRAEHPRPRAAAGGHRRSRAGGPATTRSICTSRSAALIERALERFSGNRRKAADGAEHQHGHAVAEDGSNTAFQSETAVAAGNAAFLRYPAFPACPRPRPGGVCLASDDGALREFRERERSQQMQIVVEGDPSIGEQATTYAEYRLFTALARIGGESSVAGARVVLQSSPRPDGGGERVSCSLTVTRHGAEDFGFRPPDRMPAPPSTGPSTAWHAEARSRSPFRPEPCVMMPSVIVHPMESLASAGKGLVHAIAIARCHGAVLHVVYARPGSGGSTAAAAAAGRLTERLHQVVAAMGPRLPRVVAAVLDGHPVHAISTYAREASADLIVMERPRRPGRYWSARGSAGAIGRAAGCPVLAVPSAGGTAERPPDGMFRRIVSAVDFSEASARALHHALTVAQHSGGRITLLHVCDGCPSAATIAGRINRALDHLVPAEARAWCDVRVETIAGSPAETIVGAARRRAAGSRLSSGRRHGRCGTGSSPDPPPAACSGAPRVPC